MPWLCVILQAMPAPPHPTDSSWGALQADSAPPPPPTAESQQCHTVCVCLWSGGAHWYAMHFPRCHSNKAELKPPPTPQRCDPKVGMGGVQHPALILGGGGGVRKGSPSAGKCRGQWGEEEAEPRSASAGSGVPKGGVTAAPRCNELGRPQLPHGSHRDGIGGHTAAICSLPAPPPTHKSCTPPPPTWQCSAGAPRLCADSKPKRRRNVGPQAAPACWDRQRASRMLGGGLGGDMGARGGSRAAWLQDSPQNEGWGGSAPWGAHIT